jgi:DNA modification methylase
MIELNKIYNEDCRETMKRMPDNFVDSIVTDPPYELGFMGKKWDSSEIAYNVDLWGECLRVLKPGGYLLAFGGTRTSHRMVCAIEDAGFEIRDSILWLYGSGFPKSMNIGKEIDKLQGNEREHIKTIKKMPSATGNLNSYGYRESYEGKTTMDITKGESIGEGWGTALKPAHEPICVARKPISEKTVAENVLKLGTGGINIDGCRIKLTGNNDPRLGGKGDWASDKMAKNVYEGGYAGDRVGSSKLGRFPANLILDPFTAGLLDEQVPNAGAFAKVKSGHNGKSKGIYGDYAEKGDDGDTFYDDKGGASRFFYVAKADKEERNAGLYQFEKVRDSDRNITDGIGGDNPRNRTNTNKNNFHPTVKPVKLIQYLQRLVTPKGGLTYDPFGGSGTSALSASNEGFNWILSEIIAEYCDLSNKRIYNNGGLFL